MLETLLSAFPFFSFVCKRQFPQPTDDEELKPANNVLGSREASTCIDDVFTCRVLDETDPSLRKNSKLPNRHDRGSNISSKASKKPQRVPSNDAGMDQAMFVQQSKAQFADRYIKEKKLGAGAYAEVIQCCDKETGAERAVKIIKKYKINPSGNDLLDEINLLKRLDHPNIMKLHEFFEDKKHYYLVSDVYKGGELFDEIIHRQRFTEADAASTMKQVLSGVTYLHKHNIVHRDLKPENLLLESKAKDALIKIVDFGLSSTFDPAQKMKARLGTAYYIAPEVLCQQYDEKCDIWSCGVILYILLCGYPPFAGSNDNEILESVAKGEFEFDPPEWDDVSPDAKKLITEMLTYEPSKRISAEMCLQHPWIKNMADREEDGVEKPQLCNALEKMRKFQASQKLAQAALLFMGSKLTTAEETKELTKIFRQLDANGDGQLDRKELIQGYAQLLKVKGGDTKMNTNQIETEVDQLLSLVDFDKNGTIEYSEFVTVAMDRNTLLSNARLKAAFQMFDQDGSGKISAAELRSILPTMDESQWQAIIKEADQNNDGEVDFEEFVTMMQRFCSSPRQ